MDATPILATAQAVEHAQVFNGTLYVPFALLEKLLGTAYFEGCRDACRKQADDSLLLAGAFQSLAEKAAAPVPDKGPVTG